MKDSFGREINYVRISVTDRCNFSCRYCHSPHVGFIPHDKVMRYEEIVPLVDVMNDIGIEKVRITGGEPLVRKGIPQLISMLNQLPVREVTMTTNAFLLKENIDPLRDAGLKRVNISLDTVDSKLFREITGVDALDTVVDGIDAAREVFSVKLNAVLMRSSLHGIEELYSFAAERGLQLRFIELMPTPGTPISWNEEFVSGSEALAILEKTFGAMEPSDRSSGSGPATLYRTAQGITVGFINSISQPFCGTCSRIRVTSDGKIRPCLGKDIEYDIMPLLRPTVMRDELREKIKEIIINKLAGHDFTGLNGKSMNSIGG